MCDRHYHSIYLTVVKQKTRLRSGNREIFFLSANAHAYTLSRTLRPARSWYLRYYRSTYTLPCTIFVSGRVHSAVVSGVNLEQRTVTVEWFERGETKGKEVSAPANCAVAFALAQSGGELRLGKFTFTFLRPTANDFSRGDSARN